MNAGWTRAGQDDRCTRPSVTYQSKKLCLFVIFTLNDLFRYSTGRVCSERGRDIRRVSPLAQMRAKMSGHSPSLAYFCKTTQMTAHRQVSLLLPQSKK